MYQGQGIAPQEPSKVGSVSIAADELQKILAAIEESSIGLKMRLISVLRQEDDIVKSTPDVGYLETGIPLEEQLRKSCYQARCILGILDGILGRIEV